ncbi:O-antigen ligase family protein [Limnohabitans sp.]|jgi:O-antigen ligase|uniref:O-antigen ligase family protein n=1 Tax=Limnohabitans sp. TaxID=1907725 RepID=UPI00286ED607|nr:O-antigen ligase family protein [Limnohabitans sp.]
MVTEQFKIYYANAVLLAIAAALLTSVAGINIGVLLLLLVTPWFWRGSVFDAAQKKWTVQFLVLIASFCLWDVVTNLVAGASVGRALLALQHDLRTFAFILLLWPVFRVEKVARFALLALLTACVAIAGANLAATWTGLIQSGEYLWPTMHHLHGQISVGMVFLLAQLWLVRPSLSWRVALPMVVLLASMFFANERRAGYLLLGVGFPVWYALNAKRLFVGRYKWWVLCAAIFALLLAAASPVVQARMARMVLEVNQFFAMTPEQRAGVETSLGIRLQFYSSIAELIQQSHWMVGVGSVHFGDMFYAINHRLGTTSEQAATYFSNFQNPHNEYLFMLATKGVIGLILYLAIFIQACRLAWQKNDEVQRVVCVMFVFLFMVSITANSMMTDMEEGHFTMLILLIFLAPASLRLFQDNPQHG